MSSVILLEGILQKLKAKYPASMNDDKLFEFYCVDNLLINYDLDHAEIESGIVDGPRDAGVDAAYVFVNRTLVTDDFNFESVKQPVEIELVIIQAKNQETFKEVPVDKLCGSLQLLLDPNQGEAALNLLFKPIVVNKFRSFIGAMQELASEFPSVFIWIAYCSKGKQPNDVILAKQQSLVGVLKQRYQNVDFKNFGAQDLYERSAKHKRLVKDLATVGTPLSGQNSYVTLCRIRDYIAMISDEEGNLITPLFEANVRAYQGEVEVNKEIAHSIKTPTLGVDFWWLNNGVTIVADQAQFMNNRLTLENPLVVNGLQTSHVLHEFRKAISNDDARMILVRVIVEKDRTKRDEVIRATNRQTNIKHSSFRATEPVHREIEDYLHTIGFYYDRRKNFYKRQGVPADRIISIDRLAQAVLAVLEQEPHTARARPTTAIRGESDYKKIFSGKKDKQPLEMYGVIVRLLSSVENHFRNIANGDNQSCRNNLKFHVLMVLSWALNGGSKLPALRIAQLDPDNVTQETMESVTKWVFDEFNRMGAEDKTAKDSAFTKHLKDLATATV
jgi:hypothetical protein